ncbi:MAG: NAD-dependent epimerase/dehydratase family protein [Oscillospiraceae bacterium]|nr:NAD-dependent epimerase/dehydratase family protein [Oscillospiraceae bacterium]
MKFFVTGAAGFIGSHICDRLLEDKSCEVVAYDNLSTGNLRFLEKAQATGRLKFIEGDLLDTERLNSAMSGCGFVFHFAANADIRRGLEHPRKDLEQNTIATFNVLEAMRQNKADKIAFPSTGPVYGEAEVIPTPESYAGVQTSLYGASKLACEGLISAYCEGFGFRAYIFRFVSILGERYPHGHVIDFYEQLRRDPSKLRILGDGNQKKSYLYIGDCLNAIFTIIEKAREKVNIYNLGVDDYCLVRDSAKWICEEMGVSPAFEFTGGDRGWVGDNPFIYLDVKKLMSLGWAPELTIEQSVKRTTRYLIENPWVADFRFAAE